MSTEANLAIPKEILEGVVKRGEEIALNLLKKAERMGMEARWQLGTLLATNSIIIKSKAEMQYLSSRWHIAVSELYRMKTLRSIYPTAERLASYITALERQGINPTWAYFKANILPQEYQTPHHFGGEESAYSQTLDKIEFHASTAAKLSTEMLNKYPKLEAPLQETVQGSLVAVAESLRETQHALDVLAPRPPDRNLIHLSAVRKLPCVVCGVKETQAHHIITAGMAEKGSDYLTISLCAFHHQNYNDWGRDRWEEKYGSQLDMVMRTLSETYGIPIEALTALYDYFSNRVCENAKY